VAFVHDFLQASLIALPYSLILGLYLDCAKAFQSFWIDRAPVGAPFQFSDILLLLSDYTGVIQNDD